MSNEQLNNEVSRTPIICSDCGAENSIRLQVIEMSPTKDLTFNLCQKCGDVKDVDVYSCPDDVKDVDVYSCPES